MRSQCGNILFLILIAIALFAGLSYAVTQSSRSGSGDVSKEKLSLLANQVIQHITAIRSATTRLLTTHNCSYDTLSFAPFNEWYDNYNAPRDGSCHIFHPNGGNVVWSKKPTGISFTPDSGDPSAHYFFQAHENFAYISGGTDNCDEFFVRITNVTQSFCEAFNNALKLNFSSIPHISEAGFNGSYQNHPDSCAVWGTATTPGNASGIDTMCIADNGGYHIVAVIIPR